MSSTFNLRNYKLAQIYIKDLDVIIAATERALNALKPFAHYKSAGRLARHLNEELAIQKTHRENCGIVIKSKGEMKIDNNT